jgi:hypothetical protein
MSTAVEQPAAEYEYRETAEILRVTEAWLKRNLGRFPHYRKAGKVTFSADHIAEIRRLCEVRPAAAAGNPVPARRRRAS